MTIDLFCRFGPKTVACNGLAAVLLGVSLLHCPAPPPDGSQPQGGVSAPVLLDIISSRIGLAAYFGLLDALKQDKQFLQAAAGPTPPKPASRGAPAREEGAFLFSSPSPPVWPLIPPILAPS